MLSKLGARSLKPQGLKMCYAVTPASQARKNNFRFPPVQCNNVAVLDNACTLPPKQVRRALAQSEKSCLSHNDIDHRLHHSTFRRGSYLRPHLNRSGSNIVCVVAPYAALHFPLDLQTTHKCDTGSAAVRHRIRSGYSAVTIRKPPLATPVLWVHW